MSLLKVNTIQSLTGGSVTADILKSIKTVESFAELSTTAGTPDYIVYMKGYYANSTSGGGLFKYNSSRAGENDSGTIVNGWERIFGDRDDLSFQMFGAKCDGVTNDTVAFGNAITSALTQHKDIVLYNTLLLSAGATVSNIPSIIGMGDSAQIKTGTGTLTISGSVGNTTNSKISNIKFTATPSTTALEIIEQTGLQISGCIFDTAAIGILLHNKNTNNKTDNVVISDTKFTANCICPLTYRKTSGTSTFIASGLRNCYITTPSTGTIKSIKIDSGCSVTNCPLSITYISNSTGSTSIIYSDELTNVHTFYGTLQIIINAGSLVLGTSSFSNLIEYTGSVVSQNSTAFSALHVSLYSIHKAKQDGGFKNKLLNGNFDIWQRGFSATASSTPRYLADRWVTYPSGSTVAPSAQAFSIGQTTVPGNPSKYHRCVVSSVAGAGNYVLFTQGIESAGTLSNGMATCSFWAKADGVKKVAVEFVQDFGPSGSSSVVGIGSTAFTLSTSWQHFSLTVFIPSISGKAIDATGGALRLGFWLDAGSTYAARAANIGQQSGTFDFSQIQVEAGNIATQFEQRPIAQELILCQRYYQKLTGAAALNNTAATSNTSSSTAFITQMRTVPVEIIVDVGATAAVTTNNITTYQSTLSNSWYFPGNISLSADL